MELGRRYSNCPELVNPLVSVLDKIKNDDADADDDLGSVHSTEPAPSDRKHHQAANSPKVELWDCNGGSNQIWQPYNGGYRNPASGRRLDDPGT